MKRIVTKIIIVAFYWAPTNDKLWERLQVFIHILFFSPSWDVHWSQYAISMLPLLFSSKHGDPVLRKWSYKKVEAARIPELPEHRTSLPMKTIIHVNNKNKKFFVLNHSYFRSSSNSYFNWLIHIYFWFGAYLNILLIKVERW